MSLLLPPPKFQFVNSAGLPYAGGSLTFYLTTTSTPQDTFPTPADATAATNANSNPLTLNSAGWPAVDIYLSQSVKYKVVLKDSAGVEIWTVDPVSTTDFSVVPLWTTFAGNPNGDVAGTASSSGVLPSIVWDRTNNIQWTCTTTGTASTAVWTAINPAASQLLWTIADRVSATPATADAGTSYIIAASFGSFTTGQIITDNGEGQFTVTAPGTDVGWIAYVQDEDRYYKFRGTTWSLFSGVNVQVITTPGANTYTPTAGISHVIAISTGGGGGSGGVDSDGDSSAASGGGGAGATCIELFTAAQIGASQTVTIGAAGAAGAATGTSGGNGGDTTFGSLHTAGGGLGGTGVAGTTSHFSAGGLGGTATGGLLNISGGDGGGGIGIPTLDSAVAGIGGASFCGGGGTLGGLVAGGVSAGAAGLAYGSGGGGSANVDTAAGQVGLVGAQGVCFVLEFFG